MKKEYKLTVAACACEEIGATIGLEKGVAFIQ
jgi:hypothetical protein